MTKIGASRILMVEYQRKIAIGHVFTDLSVSAGGVNFLGVVRVIGSLIIVGLELRQSQRIALAEMEQRRSLLTAK